MIIQTKRLVIRPFEEKDKQWYYNLTGDEEFKTRLPGLIVEDFNAASKDVDVFKKADFIKDFYLVIEDKNQNPIGIVVAVSMSNIVIDVSYFLEKRYRNNGFMSEEINEFVKAVRKKYPSYVFEFQIAKDNFKSLNVVKRLGASIEFVNQYDNYVCYI